MNIPILAIPSLLVTLVVAARCQNRSQLLANRPRRLCGTSNLQPDNLDQIDQPTHIIRFILLASQAIYLHRDCRKRLLLPVEMVSQHIFLDRRCIGIINDSRTKLEEVINLGKSRAFSTNVALPKLVYTLYERLCPHCGSDRRRKRRNTYRR